MIAYSTTRICDSYDTSSCFRRQTCKGQSCIAGSLDSDCFASKTVLVMSKICLQDKQSSLSSCDISSLTTSQLEGFACDDSWGERLCHRFIGVSHPCHDTTIGIDVRCWDIFFWSDLWSDSFGICSTESLQLSIREFFGVDDDSSFSSSQRNINNCCFE